MTNDISVRGYVTVVLVMNMRHFIDDDDAKLFEMLRGTRALREVLRNEWSAKIESQSTFRIAQHPVDPKATTTRMATDEVAFLSGIFRSSVLADHSVPLYYLSNKDGVDFPEQVRDNLQFKHVFLEVWKYWDIYVRPTVTGLFVITLRRRYDRTTSLLKIASDVVSLQTAFDIPGAHQRLQDINTRIHQGNGALQAKKQSIEAFLDWLEVDHESKWQPRYAPVQWKLAVEVCRKLILDAGLMISTGPQPIHLQVKDKTTYPPLHDSFIIYHLDEMIAVAPIVQKARSTELEERAAGEAMLAVGQSPIDTKAARIKTVPKVYVTPLDILNSEELQQQVVALLEGAVLRRSTNADPNGSRRPAAFAKSNGSSKGYFPEHRLPHIQETLNCNAATWQDELCILTSRAALIMPGQHARRDELLLSNFASSTGKVMYLWYWEAMERMFEFVVESRVLTQQIERASSELLEEFELELSRVRYGMSQRNIRVDYAVLTKKVERVANLSRLLGLGRSLTAPSVWGRAAFAVEKAQMLLEHQDVPTLMDHAEKNVASLNEMVNHIDELYLADLSESSNRMSFYLSTLLAGLSLSVIIFTVISFWADADNLAPASLPSWVRSFVPVIVQIGNGMSLVLSLIAFCVICIGITSFARNTVRDVRARKRRLRR